jgi:hypothetical protein
MYTAAIPTCKICGEPVFNKHHKCPPAWQGRIEGVHEDDEFHHEVIYAASPMAAARSLVRIYKVYDPCTVTVRSGEEEITLDVRVE